MAKGVVLKGMDAATGLAKALCGYAGDDLRVVVDRGGARYDAAINTLYLPAVPGDDMDHDTLMLTRAYVVHEAMERRDAGKDRNQTWVNRVLALPTAEQSRMHRLMNYLSDVRLNRGIMEEFPGGGVAILHAIRKYFGEPCPASANPTDRVGYAVLRAQYGLVTEVEALAEAGEYAGVLGPFVKRLPLATQDECWQVATALRDAMAQVAKAQPKPKPETGSAPKPEGDEGEAGGEGGGKGGGGSGGEAAGDEGDEAGEGESGSGGGEGAGEGEGDEDEDEDGGGNGGGGGGDSAGGDDDGTALPDVWKQLQDALNKAAADLQRKGNAFEADVNTEGVFAFNTAADSHFPHSKVLSMLKALHPRGLPAARPLDNAAVQVMATRLRQGLATPTPTWVRHRDQGVADRRKIAQLAQGLSTDVMRRRLPVEGIDTAVLISVDQSASMSGKQEETAAAMRVFVEALRAVKIPAAVRGWTGNSHILATLDLLPWGAKTDHATNVLLDRFVDFYSNCTPTGRALADAVDFIAKRPERRKVVLFLTDGSPDICNGHHAYIRTVMKRAHRMGVEVIPVAIATTFRRSPFRDYPQSVEIPTAADLRRKGGDRLLQVLRHRVAVK